MEKKEKIKMATRGISKCLLGYRLLRSLNQRELAKELDLSLGSICRIESGTMINEATVKKLFNWLFV